MARQKTEKNSDTPSSTFKVGAIALAFLIIGYQSALFVHRAAALHIASQQEHPDTVYVVDGALAARLLGSGDDSGASEPADGGETVTVRRNASHSEAAERVRWQTRRVETFRFNPNTVSIEDLIRLGFTEKQAHAIDNYRQKGGRFRRPSDFARSYVVSDSVFARLEPYIVIPKTDINRADSAAFDALPGIGPWFAAKMIEYRCQLGGYSYKEQLLDIYHFDQEKYDALADLITCSPPPQPFRLWTLPEDSLRLHPYIRTRQAAHSIVLYRTTMPPDQWTVEALAASGILPPEDASRLARCAIAEP
ncbi:MAG: helix-hairpin-helix domain-containing protein [Bacteroidales bacterium]|nr:helix-hairpin-helix domain-containing protein [Bacteroidales bacterium]